MRPLLTRALLALISLVLIALALIGRLQGFIGFEAATLPLALLGIGAFLLITSLYPEQASRLYRLIAMATFSLVLLGVGLEILVVLSLNMQLLSNRQGSAATGVEPQYQADADWLEQLWQEQLAITAATQYRPFVLWGHEARASAYFTITAEGQRLTPTSPCTNPEARQIWLFGGSTMWDYGVQNAETIPAYLAETLGTAVCVVNYGELSFASTQEVLQLWFLLRSGNVPDVVLFYDGINDVLAAYETGTATAHRQYSLLERVFTVPETGFGAMLKRTYTLQFINALSNGRLFPSEQKTGNCPNHAVLSAEILAVYQGNQALVALLAEHYGFDYRFIWQASLIVGDKPFIGVEQRLADFVPDELNALFQASYQRANELSATQPNMVYLGDMFAGDERFLYFDFQHLIPAGNQSIAERLAELLQEELLEDA